MQHRKKLITVGLLLLASLLIHLYSLDPQRVEKGYSAHFFPFIASLLRRGLGWLPFSLGDILYAAAFIWIVIKLIDLGKVFFRRNRENIKERGVKGILSVTILCASLYIIFNILWGINYNRQGIATQIGLDVRKYSTEDLKMINGVLAEKINASKIALMRGGKGYPSDRELFDMTKAAYDRAAEKYTFLRYVHPCIKRSMWGWIGNYTGFLGYYNPFTGEAQLNTTVPKFTQPFTVCHETAHQLGYAKEMEANFVGYLAAVSSEDTLFHYSVYTDLFSYANRSLYFADSAASRIYRQMLLPQVTEDFKERKRFAQAHTSFLEPIVRAIYGKYLESNQQPKGMMSYDEVTAFIIAYYKKFGRI